MNTILTHLITYIEIIAFFDNDGGHFVFCQIDPFDLKIQLGNTHFRTQHPQISLEGHVAIFYCKMSQEKSFSEIWPCLKWA